MFDVSVLAYNIKKHREMKKISQKELAEKIFVSPQAISKWERGLAVPEIDKLCLLAELLGSSLDALIGHIEETETPMIGIDGGGTKTEYILFNERGTIFRRIIGEGTNPNFYGRDNVCEELTSNIKVLLAIKPNTKGIFIGGAGFLTSKNGEYVKESLKKAFPMLKIRCKGDMINIIASATDEEECLGSISGTGNITFAYKSGEITKYGGYGTLFDVAGCGYTIGKEAISAALKASEGIGKETLITKLVCEKVGGSILDHLQSIYRENASYIASFAKIVFEAMEQGDELAREIIETNAKYVADMINIAYEKNNKCKTVVLAGSLYKNEFFFETVKRGLCNELCVVTSDLPPVLGACVLACKLMEVDPKPIKENFRAEYEKSII